MKLLFDQNISHRILKILPKVFEGSSTVKKEKLINASDKIIWDFAKLNQYTIVSKIQILMTFLLSLLAHRK